MLSILHYTYIGILLVLLALQVFQRTLLTRYIRPAVALTIFLTTAILLYLTRAQFMAWATAGPPASYLVPPYDGIGYFFFYVFFRLWAPYLVSAGIALLVYYVAHYGNRHYGERFFYPEESFILALSIFAVGHPLWIGYLLLTLTAYCLYLVLRRLYTKRTERVTFYYFWLPIAIATLAALPLLQHWESFLLLKL